MNYQSELDELVEIVHRENGSDLHISEGRHPTVRVSGSLIPLIKKAPLTKVTPTDFLTFS